MLGQAADSGDFQWGQVVREKPSIIMQHRVKTQDSEAGLAKTTGCKGPPEEVYKHPGLCRLARD